MGAMVVATAITYFRRRSIMQATIIVAATFLVAGVVGFFVGLPYDNTVEHTAAALLPTDPRKSEQASFHTVLLKERQPCAAKSGKVSDVRNCELFGIRLGMTVDEVKKVIDESGYFSKEASLTKPCGNPDSRCVGIIYSGDSDVLNVTAEFSASRDDASRLVASQVTMWLGSGTNPYFEPANMRETFVRLFGPPDSTYQDHDKWGDVDETGGALIRAYPYEKNFVVILKDNPPPIDAPLSQKLNWCGWAPTQAVRIMACTAVIEARELTDEKRAAAYDHRGNWYNMDNDRDRAIADYTDAIRINPNYAAAYRDRAFVFLSKQENDVALVDLDTAIRIDPKDANAYAGRADAYSAKGDYDHAIADATEAIQIDPEHESAYVSRAEAYRKKGDYGHALEDLGEALRIDPKYSYAYETRALTNFYAGKYDAAASDLEHLVTGDDPDPDDVLLLYIARARLRHESAVAQLETNAAKLKQRDWPVPVVELFLGRRTPEETLAAAPNFPNLRCDAEFYVGEWYLLRANRAAAMDHLKASAQMCPSDEDARAELKHLEE
jgi:lipoprotein NlpI